MKKRYMLLVAMTILMVLSGCEKKENYVYDLKKTTPDYSEETSTTEKSVKKNKNKKVLSTKNKKEKKKNIKVSKLFADFYIPYAERKKATIFEIVKGIAQKSKYKTEINDETEEFPATIKIIDENGDYVYIVFKTVDIPMDCIMLLNYYQSNTDKEVSMSNYSSYNTTRYDSYTLHKIGKKQKHVKGLKKQKEFLFAKS